ncbi:MAG: helix-turn-helix domain containing protein [Actinomycetota bacterium]|nr:helix-turn-helix domain containing protein [Actinomycetota bacterium]MDA8210227.1 helix-turn-helix domain containing protein [Actinomycetota bacterium]
MAGHKQAAPLRADDLTAKARIRNAALILFAENGVDATSLRVVAEAAGVTVGLIVHHYGTKEALREAVELAIVDQFEVAIESVPLNSQPPAKVVTERDLAVARMLQQTPAIVDYLRRAILDGKGERGDLVSRLSELTAQQVRELRDAGLASTKNTLGEQVISIMVRQLGRLFLQPLVDQIADEFAAELTGSQKPRLTVTVER